MPFYDLLIATENHYTRHIDFFGSNKAVQLLGVPLDFIFFDFFKNNSLLSNLNLIIDQIIKFICNFKFDFRPREHRK